MDSDEDVILASSYGAQAEVGETTPERQPAPDIDDDAMRGIFDTLVTLAPGHVLTSKRAPSEKTCLVIEGFLVHCLRHQARRSIVGLSMPGDIIGLSASGSDLFDHDVMTLGPATVAQVDYQRFRDFASTMPDLVTRLTSATAARQRRWIANSHWLNAAQHVAHLFCEIRHRLGQNGRLKKVVRTPFSQIDLGDMCGVSSIHVNRAVANLRRAGIGELRRGTFYTSDWAMVEDYAHFDPAYLLGD